VSCSSRLPPIFGPKQPIPLLIHTIDVWEQETGVWWFNSSEAPSAVEGNDTQFTGNNDIEIHVTGANIFESNNLSTYYVIDNILIYKIFKKLHLVLVL